ncbi:hypothetical protein A3L04_01705 [Thermococcus chitonophagus]|uniref:UPF0146 protein A3L04_01705 n=1 Tax=Thermococcus chitonophagus TaxID=54262 RepID=A0A160VRB7_9EURY|nr:UPF0146 family protein [Thermococcus chitonophagus]ASJ15879.1 hypothetical protein A3L04_01705 [Thermococcus chitonophagus]CUX77119.1 UPF0146 protein MJ0688 [Thermococcus chitonophagus]
MDSVAEFIAKKCRGGKVIEVGIGFYTKVAERLGELNINIIVIDANKDAIRKARELGLNGYVDDIFNPSLELYKGACCIYSIRPTPEMMPALLKLAKRLGIPLYIIPLTGDSPPREMKLINYKGIPIYKWEP